MVPGFSSSIFICVCVPVIFLRIFSDLFLSYFKLKWTKSLFHLIISMTCKSLTNSLIWAKGMLPFVYICFDKTFFSPFMLIIMNCLLIFPIYTSRGSNLPKTRQHGNVTITFLRLKVVSFSSFNYRHSFRLPKRA